MSELSRDQVLALVHPLDDATIAEIIATGVTRDELKKACAFYKSEKKQHAHHDIPLGRVGRVISILERVGASIRESPLGEGGSTLE